MRPHRLRSDKEVLPVAGLWGMLFCPLNPDAGPQKLPEEPV